MLIALEPRIATDLYVASGVTAGQQLIIQNTGAASVRVATSEADVTNGLIVRPGETVVNELDDGAWAIAATGGIVLDVREAGV